MTGDDPGRCYGWYPDATWDPHIWRGRTRILWRSLDLLTNPHGFEGPVGLCTERLGHILIQEEVLGVTALPVQRASKTWSFTSLSIP